ncbi:MAG: hypothetical protein L0Y72_15375 [Gemmataceae bacterium]|nr:hypothetical protein [Gemmataceae bacterium]MCI0740426.1 hypothetical protein [Gemmataceae bacterium]
MFDIHQSVFDEHNDWDDDRVAAYVNGLVEEFARSSEGEALTKERAESGLWAGYLIEFYFQYVDGKFAEITSGDLEEIVFSVFPRKVATEPENAAEIISELRAFWTFLSLQYQLPQASEMLALLDDRAVETLRDRLADPGLFGMAKSFFMLGDAAGFDMTTQEGLNELTDILNGFSPGSIAAGISDAPLRSKKDLRKKRKAQRQARKRQRR